MILPLLMMQQISSLQQGQVGWCLHHLIRQGMQKLCLHSSYPNSYSVFERQIAHFSAVLSATSMIFFILLAILGLMEGSVLLEDASVVLFLLASVRHFLERQRVYLLDMIVFCSLCESARFICWDVERSERIYYELAHFSQLLLTSKNTQHTLLKYSKGLQSLMTNVPFVSRLNRISANAIGLTSFRTYLL